MKAPMTPLLLVAAISTLGGCKHLSADSSTAAMDSGIPEVVQTNCLSCHSVSAKHEPTNAIAPPLFAVKNHLSEFSDRDAFIAHVSEWVKSPDAENARMPGAVKKFGLMPALPLADDVLAEISAWLYDTPMNKPNWYAEHYLQEHGEAPAE